MLGFARPDSICDNVDTPTPAAAAAATATGARAPMAAQVVGDHAGEVARRAAASSIVLIYRTMRSRFAIPLVRQAIAMAVAVGAVGIAFGALAADGGLSLAKALALSGLVYGGSAQLAALGVAVEAAAAPPR